MYKVYVNGAFKDHAEYMTEAMGVVAKWATPYSKDWHVVDPYQKIVAMG